jgi:hypothetical protein
MPRAGINEVQFAAVAVAVAVCTWHGYLAQTIICSLQLACPFLASVVYLCFLPWPCSRVHPPVSCDQQTRVAHVHLVQDSWYPVVQGLTMAVVLLGTGLRCRCLTCGIPLNRCFTQQRSMTGMVQP